MRTLNALATRVGRKSSVGTPVEKLLQQTERRVIKASFPFDDFTHRFHSYLSWALELGLTDEAAVYACADLAETRTDDWWFAAERERKTAAWKQRREAALAVARAPRSIDMELDPAYFSAMLLGRKPFEGRSYDPESDKNYADIRTGDTARYSLSNRQPEFITQIGALGLRPDQVMARPIIGVHFSPTVFELYESISGLGEEFQPNLPGIFNVLARGAIYYTFPLYTDRISEHGFIGIEHPQGIPELVSAGS